MKNLFEMATRNKLRFAYRGVISVEDLWDLRVEQLDEIYKSLVADQKKANEESLLKTKTTVQEEADIKIDIVKHIVEVKLTEANQRIVEKEKKEKKQFLMGILAEKENQDFKNKSVDELKAMLKDLD